MQFYFRPWVILFAYVGLFFFYIVTIEFYVYYANKIIKSNQINNCRSLLAIINNQSP